MRWSISAHKMFRRCQRQYFFDQIVASPRSRDPSRREAHILKQLKHVSTWQGILVHTGIASFAVPLLRAGQGLSADPLVEQTMAVARQQFAFSTARRYRETGLSKAAAGVDFCALFDHEYGRGNGLDPFPQVQAAVAQCFNTLCSLDELVACLSRRAWYGVEHRLSTSLEEGTLAVQLDLLFFRGWRKPTVVDWKVEQAGDNSRQMGVYALALAKSSTWPGIRAEDIEVLEVNLLSGAIRRHSFTRNDLEEAEDFVLQSMTSIGALTGDHRYESQRPEDYEVANSPRTCEYCSFQRLCSEVERGWPDGTLQISLS